MIDKIQIMTDSASDIPVEIENKYSIPILALHNKQTSSKTKRIDDKTQALIEI